MIKPITEKIIKQLKKSNLSLEDRTALVTVLLSELHTLPLDNTFIVEQGQVTINGKDLDVDQVIVFRDSCLALKDNFAFKVIKDQIRYLAMNLGIYKSRNMDELFFYKTALWNLQQIDELLSKIID
jgi:hypothetical protein